MKKIAVVCILLIISAIPAFAQMNEKLNNQYIEGYATSLLKEKYSMDVTVSVRSGEMYIPERVSSHEQYDAIIQDLSKIEGVNAIKLVNESESKRISRVWVLPNEPLFKPLVADPRWPDFAFSYHYYSESDIMDNGINLNLGKTFPIVRTGLGEKIYTEVGFQAGAFTTFDLYNNTLTLINTDILIGLPVTLAWDSVTFIGRFYHQRSNVGDKYLRKHNIQDVNFNFEAIDGILAFNPNSWFRIYAGLGYVLDSDPVDYGPLMYQTGMEVKIIPDNTNIPTSFLAVDIKGNEETHYNPSLSFKFGVEATENIMVTAEIYTGRSYIGQFFEDRVTYFGLGVHIY